MSDFQVSTEVKRTRKPHVCNHCGQEIAKGSAALKMAGRYDGDFYQIHVHPDCMEAGNALADIAGNYGEEYVWLNQIEEKSDFEFIAEKYPAVAERMGIGQTTPESRDA